MSEIKRVKTNADLSTTNEYPGRMGACYTRTRFIPIRDKVLVKAIWEENPLVIKQEEAVRKTSPKFTQVVGFGDEVRGLEIFDEIKIGYMATIEPVYLEENEQSISKKIKLLENISIDPKANKKLYMVEYYCVPHSAILGIMK